MPTDTGEVMSTGLVITPASLEVLAAQANAAHEAVKELMGTALAKARVRVPLPPVFTTSPVSMGTFLPFGSL